VYWQALRTRLPIAASHQFPHPMNDVKSHAARHNCSDTGRFGHQQLAALPPRTFASAAAAEIAAHSSRSGERARLQQHRR
jgi:hypothetical protein